MSCMLCLGAFPFGSQTLVKTRLPQKQQRNQDF